MVGDFITTMHQRKQLRSLRETNEINSTSSCLGPLVFFVSKTDTLFAASDLDQGRPYAIPLVRPLPIHHLDDWRKMEVCLIHLNKGEDDEGVFKILLYSDMECNCVRKITEGLFRKYSTL